VSAIAPKLIFTRFPDDVAQKVGLQSILKRFPVVKVFVVAEIEANLPVVKDPDKRLKPTPVVTEFAPT
jgi:hypothetical protein